MSTIVKSRIEAYNIDGDSLIALINEEGQYSIWPAKKEVRPDWHNVGFKGSKAEVSTYIDEHWVDICPVSLRNLMDSNH
jgi:MbtH protein